MLQYHTFPSKIMQKMEKPCDQLSKVKTSLKKDVSGEIKKNPLREFFKKPETQCSHCKTMAELNQGTVLKEIANNQPKPELPPISISEIKVDINGRTSCSNGFSPLTQSKYSAKNGSILENSQEGETMQRGSQKKITFSSRKINMSELFNITEAPITDEYQLQEKIGEGAFGQVFKAIHKVSQEMRAVKIIKRRLMNEKQIKQFLSQTSLLKKISHPSIIRIFDILQHENSLYVVMEYCKGGCITDSLNKIPKKSQKIVAKIMKQVFGALSYIHSLNIIHRDLKTQNIVFLDEITNQNLNDFLPIKIIDFGTAVQMQYKVEHNGSVAGTIPYMAPEAFKGVLTEKSDIWSCAVMMVKMLTGINPFSGQSDKDTMKNIANKILNFYEKPFSLVSNEARDILQKIFDRNHHKRPSAADLLTHPWFNDIKPIQTKRLSIIKQLEHYEGKDNLFSIIECYLTLKKTNQKEREQLAKIFSGLDKDCSGQIDKKEFYDVFHKVSPSMTDEELRNVIDLIDKDRSGKIDFNQFLVAMSQREHLFLKDSLGQAFDHFDRDKTGFLQINELRSILKHCPIKQVQFFIQRLDTNKDHVISKEEFIQYLTHP